MWVVSSVGRASPLQGEGHWFDPSSIHHPLYRKSSLSLHKTKANWFDPSSIHHSFDKKHLTLYTRPRRTGSIPAASTTPSIKKHSHVPNFNLYESSLQPTQNTLKLPKSLFLIILHISFLLFFHLLLIFPNQKNINH